MVQLQSECSWNQEFHTNGANRVEAGISLLCLLDEAIKFSFKKTVK